MDGGDRCVRIGPGISLVAHRQAREPGGSECDEFPIMGGRVEWLARRFPGPQEEDEGGSDALFRTLIVCIVLRRSRWDEPILLTLDTQLLLPLCFFQIP